MIQQWNIKKNFFKHLFFNFYLLNLSLLHQVLAAACVLLSCSMQDLVPWPGIEPKSPVLEGEFLTTVLSGKSL